MHKSLFLCIVDDVTAACPYFRQRSDVRGTVGFTLLQKCITALRRLAYATSPDTLDENLRMFRRTA